MSEEELKNSEQSNQNNSESQETQKVRERPDLNKLLYLQYVDGSRSTFRVGTEDASCLAVAASSFTWSHTDNPEYWALEEIENSLFKSALYRCKYVWWFNPELVVEGILTGAYHIYIRHGNTYLSSPKIKVYQVKGDDQGQDFKGWIHPFREETVFGEENKEILVNTYAGTIYVSAQELPSTIKLQMFSSDQCIQNYLFEGFLLVPTLDIETPPSYFYPLDIDSGANVDWERKAQAVYMASFSTDPNQALIEQFEDKQIKIVGHIRGETSGHTHEGPENLLQSESKWCVTNAHHATAFIDLDEEISFRAFGLISGNDCPERDPKQVVLSVIFNGDDEYRNIFIIHSHLKFDQRNEKRLFMVSNEGIKTRHIKIEFKSDHEVNQFQISEVLFFK